MKRSTGLTGIHFLTVLVFAAVTATLRTIACISDFNFKTGYFADSVLITISNCLAIVGVIISLAYLIVGKNTPNHLTTYNSALAYIPAGIVSVTLAFFAASAIYDLAKLPGTFFSEKTFSDSSNVMLAALAVLALVSIAYFMLETIFEKRAVPERGGLGLVFVAFLALYAAYVYFGDSMPINSQIKITDQIAFSFAAVFFLFECRISLGRSITGGYVALGGAAAILAAYSSIPALITYFVKKSLVSDSLPAVVLLFGIFMLVISRLAILALSKEDKRCDTAESIAMMSRARVDELEAARHARAHADIINEENRESDEVTVAEDDNYTMDLEDILDNTAEDGIE